MKVSTTGIRCTAVLIAISSLSALAWAQPRINPKDYAIDAADIARAQRLIDTPVIEAVTMPTQHPDAQWYPTAALGLFMHWGIHSVAGIQPSWNMIKHYRYGGKRYYSPRRYYKLADRFRPTQRQDSFLTAARRAGFTYAVLTARHHDGYALWPSKYGIGVRQYLPGRDLVREYVQACRRAGLKVGLYFSPRDWHYPGFMEACEFNVRTRQKVTPITDTVANHREYVRFLAYVMRQMEELLTQYGKIDLLWLDGMGWHGINENNTEKIYTWVRSMQPGIVINDRWANLVDPDNPNGTQVRIGDITTPFECGEPTYIPSPWWEVQDLWTYGGGWGYDRKEFFRPMAWFFNRWTQARALGGNFLVNVGPRPDGDMPREFYAKMDSLAQWMAYGRESVIGTGITPGPELCSVKATSRGADTLYAHIMPKGSNQVSLITARKPARVTLLRTGEELSFIHREGFLHFAIPKERRTAMDDVVRIVF